LPPCWLRCRQNFRRPDQETPQRTETFSWDKAEQLLPGMTAELNAFLEANFTRAREDALTVLRNLLEKAIGAGQRHVAVRGRTSPLAQVQLAYSGLLEHAHQQLRPQMLSKARAAMRSRLSSTQDTELIVAMHLLIDNCIDRFTCDLILEGITPLMLQAQAVREADICWRLEHPQRANELPVFTEQIAALFSRDALAIVATALFAADENAIANAANTLNKEQYQAGKRLYDLWWNNLREKKITLEQWNKNLKEPMAKLTGQLFRHEVAATFDLLE
jgi:hypothetical protein